MVYIFLAPGFEESEALVPCDLLRRAGIETALVGVTADAGAPVASAREIRVLPDYHQSELVCDEKLEMVFLPGGMPGTRNLEQSPAVLQAVEYCAQNGRYIAAICAAPSILGHLGLLRGKKACCFPSFEAELEGALVCTESVCVDGRIITGRGAGVAFAFGLQLVASLRGTQAARAVRDAIQCAPDRGR